MDKKPQRLLAFFAVDKSNGVENAFIYEEEQLMRCGAAGY